MAQVLSPGAIPAAPVPIVAPEWEENLNVVFMCNECRELPPNVVEDHSSGDTLCGDCGLVMSARGIDTRPEWRTFTNDDKGNDDPSRVGDAPNPLLNGNQLETSIAFGDGSMRSKELHRAQSKATADKTTKGLLQAFKQIGAYCDAYSLPAIVSDGAKHLYKDADESKLFKGKAQEAIIASCIFISCRRNSVPRSFREVYEMTKVSKKEIGRTFKLLEKFLMTQSKNKGSGTTVVANGKCILSYLFAAWLLMHERKGVVAMNETYHATATTNPGELCARFCSILGLDQRVTNVAIDLAEKMSSGGALAGRSPLSGAAACIYMASYLMGSPRTPKQISEAAKVSDSTIRNAYKNLYNEREKFIQPEWLSRGGNVDNLPKPS